MVPGATLIECNREKGECVEATASAFNDYLSAPTVDTYRATFFPAAINYENDDPVCAHYSVRIDLQLKKVFAVRERKSLSQNEMCKNLERKIEMTLANGYQADEQPFKGHFVPLIRSIVWLLSLT